MTLSHHAVTYLVYCMSIYGERYVHCCQITWLPTIPSLIQYKVYRNNDCGTTSLYTCELTCILLYTPSSNCRPNFFQFSWGLKVAIVQKSFYIGLVSWKPIISCQQLNLNFNTAGCQQLRLQSVYVYIYSFLTKSRSG